MRAFVRAQDLTPLGAAERRAMHAKAELAAGYAADEGEYRAPIVAAWCKLMFVDGATDAMRRATVK